MSGISIRFFLLAVLLSSVRTEEIEEKKDNVALENANQFVTFGGRVPSEDGGAYSSSASSILSPSESNSVFISTRPGSVNQHGGVSNTGTYGVGIGNNGHSGGIGNFGHSSSIGNTGHSGGIGNFGQTSSIGNIGGGIGNSGGGNTAYGGGSGGGGGGGNFIGDIRVNSGNRGGSFINNNVGIGNSGRGGGEGNYVGNRGSGGGVLIGGGGHLGAGGGLRGGGGGLSGGGGVHIGGGRGGGNIGGGRAGRGNTGGYNAGGNTGVFQGINSEASVFGGASGGGGGGGYNPGGGGSNFFDASPIPGTAGVDYPVHAFIPFTGFNCPDVGYYADTSPEAGCQVFHICQSLGRIDSFLCPNGTIFNQQYFVCDWWFNFDCSTAQQFYGLNEEIGRVNNINFIAGNSIDGGGGYGGGKK